LKLVAREIPKEDREEWWILKWSEGGKQQEENMVTVTERDGKRDENF
jgi:hypothetical protein